MESGCRALLPSCLAVLALVGLNACPSSCLEDSVCGNGIAEGSEACDGLDLRGRTCADLTARPFGSLVCTAWCSFDRSDCTVCGDGIAEGSEECDLLDHRGYDCDSVLPGSQGTLACTRECARDPSVCTICGDGERQWGEPCDCGSDASRLPEGCTDVNGGDDANCSADCQKLAYCGDGISDQGEDCDCGADASNLPLGCSDVNGGSNGSCTEECLVYCCGKSYWETCDPLTIDDCGRDDWGVELVCTLLPESGNPAHCSRLCSQALDCPWGSSCSSVLGDRCRPEACGSAGGWPNAEVNALCVVSNGGGQGWCAPVVPREEPTDQSMGLCIEGNLAHDATCFPHHDFGADRSEMVCQMGFCSAAPGAILGTCHQLCDWQAAYAVAFYQAAASTETLPCPPGANCFASSFIDPTTGVRSGDFALCYDTLETDPSHGFTACSLVTGRLLANPALTCLAAGFTEGTCVMLPFTTGAVTNGSVLGVCADGTAAPNLSVWEACDPASPSDVCPEGCLCEKPDVFVTTPIMAERCVPQCDTAHPSGAWAHCSDLGAVPTADGTPFCQSISLLFPPGGPLDILPSRLGLCGL